MRATGIVRRIDDLGRIVIPKEIRKNLRIKEGDPLELFTTKDGEVVFKKYSYCTEQDWAKAKAIVKEFTNVPFALYDNYGDIQEMTKKDMPIYCDSENCAIYNEERDIIGFVYFDGVVMKDTARLIRKVLGKVLADD